MKLSLRALSLVSCMAALVAAAPLAHADSVSGSVWEGAIADGATLTGTPGTTPTSTFTVSGAGDVFNFSGGPLSSSPSYTLGGFLTSGGDSVTYATGAGAAGDSINHDIFAFSGTTDLTAGTNYVFTHDDGMLLYVDGTLVINSGSATSAKSSHWFDSGLSGPASFELLYAESNGAPAELNGYLGTTASTPEPSSFILLGSGLLAAAGVVRRRLAV